MKCVAWHSLVDYFFWHKNYKMFKLIYYLIFLQMIIFADDLKYWGIEEKYLEICCLNRFTTCKETIMDEINKELLNMKEVKPVDEFPNTIYGQYMKFVWVGI